MSDLNKTNAAVEALPPLAAMVRALDMRARKSLGQNFLFDLNLTRRIARSAGTLTGTTIEVGPGPGGLTRALLLEGAETVVAIEKDFRAGTVLDRLLAAADGRLELIEGDALKTPLWDIGTAPRRIIANLPYNIATSLLIQWLEHASAFELPFLVADEQVCPLFVAEFTDPTEVYFYSEPLCFSPDICCGAHFELHPYSLLILPSFWPFMSA